jgi:outer membrane protein
MKRFIIVLKLLIIICTVASQAQDTLEMVTAIQIGLENNFDIKISKGQKNIATNNNTYGNAGFLPTLDLNSASRYTKENTSQVFISGDELNRDGAKSNVFSAGAVINWTFFDGTTKFYTKDRLEEMEKQGIAITESVIQNIFAQITKEFYTVALEQIRLGLLFENIGLSEDRLDIAKNKYEFGKSSKMEFLQAQVDLNRDISNHMIQQERLASSKTALNELLGRDVTLDFYVHFNPELNTGLNYEELNATMEKNNPELLANRYEMNASKLVKKELFGERIPELGLNLGYNYTKSEAEAGFLLSRQSSGLNYGLSATWNLFNGLNLNRRIQNAKILEENVELNYEAVKLSLERELYSTFISYQNNIQLYSMEEQNKEVANENNEIAIERYRVGNSSPLELREAQINLLEANLRYLNAAYTVMTGEIDLLFLSGTLLE